MSESTHNAYLTFTVGPVQGFVGQARRTRDLWASSWLLSHLSEGALIAAENAGGTSIVPYRSKSGQWQSKNSHIGGVPNRFEMGFPNQDAAAKAGAAAVSGFVTTWKDLCQRVWDRFVSDAAQKHGKNTREIWDRQIENFWELSWVVAESKSKAGHLAAARKSFRNSPTTVEKGYKCSLMGSHQELSGHLGKGKQNGFWKAFRDTNGISQLDVPENERLCAISLVKRLYPKVVDALKDTETVSWPSTSFIAALPWLKGLEGDLEFAAREYVSQARSLGIDQNETASAKEFNLRWANLDASVWYQGGLQRNEWELKTHEQEALTRSLKSLVNEKGKKPLLFWALLVMDGDSLGKLLEKLDSPTELSQCLERFSATVSEIVTRHNGKTIYAGGDDVLAMVAAESAVEAAIELAKKYEECFQDTKAKGAATLSGAIVFAPLHAPFQQLIKQGHHLLDAIAKERTGRNALAIDIVLGSGLSARWAAPWPVILGQAGSPGLLQVLDRFQQADERDEEGNPVYNASFLYGLREQFLRLFPALSGHPGDFGKFELSDDDSEILRDIANAQYRRRLSKSMRAKSSVESTRAGIEELMWLSRLWERNTAGECVSHKRSFSFDGWRIARFLQQVKEGDLGDHEGFH